MLTYEDVAEFSEALRVTMIALSEIGSVSKVYTIGWEEAVENSDVPAFFLQENAVDVTESTIASFTDISLYVWGSSSELARKTADSIARMFDRRSLINAGGWIQWAEVPAGTEPLPAPNERVAGFGIRVQLTTRK